MFKILLLNNKSKICHSFFSWKHTEHFSNFYLFWILQQKQFWNNLIHGGFLTEKKFLTCWTSTESEFSYESSNVIVSFSHVVTKLKLSNRFSFKIFLPYSWNIFIRIVQRNCFFFLTASSSSIRSRNWSWIISMELTFFHLPNSWHQFRVDWKIK